MAICDLLIRYDVALPKLSFVGTRLQKKKKHARIELPIVVKLNDIEAIHAVWYELQYVINIKYV